MLTYTRHHEPFNAAIQAAEPLILLPPLHPRYLQSLIADWQGTPGTTREARLIEPWVGSMKITKHGLSAPADAGRELALGQWLMRQYDALDAGGERVWWVPELDAALTDPQQLALLVATARRIATSGARLRLLLGAPAAELPAALRPWTRQLELMAPRLEDDGEDGTGGEDADFGLRLLGAQKPDGAALAAALRAHTLDEGKDNAARRFTKTLQGLDAGAMNIVVEAFYREYKPTIDIASQWRALESKLNDERKRQLQRASGLSVVDVSQEELKGMNRFQRYLEYVDVLLRDRMYDRKEGGPRPRGVLLVGLPGTGKSLAAHTTARKLGLPLLRIDIGAMMGRYLGESEGNLRRALDAAEAAAPCVLWVDELEKALGGIATGQSDSSGTGSRMLAQLLTWMQSHDAQVYLFATANKVHDLPPELLRRGRFDELWRVMLPRDEERQEILLSKLAKVGDEADADLLSPQSAALTELVKITKDYTGADLEALVNEAWMRARVQEVKVTGESIKDVIKNFKPLSSQFADKIKADIEVLDKHGFLDVSCDPNKLLTLVPDARKISNRIHPDLMQFFNIKNEILEITNPSDKNFTIRAHLSKEEANKKTLTTTTKEIITIFRTGNILLFNLNHEGKETTFKLSKHGEKFNLINETNSVVFEVKKTPNTSTLIKEEKTVLFIYKNERYAFQINDKDSNYKLFIMRNNIYTILSNFKKTKSAELYSEIFKITSTYFREIVANAPISITLTVSYSGNKKMLIVQDSFNNENGPLEETLVQYVNFP